MFCTNLVLKGQEDPDRFLWYTAVQQSCYQYCKGSEIIIMLSHHEADEAGDRYLQHIVLSVS